MSNPMIRSHTGNMVDARVGMRCTVEKSNIPVTIETIDGDCAWCSFDVCGETRNMVYTASHLNMKFCPFAVGDEYHWRLFGCKGFTSWATDTVMTELEANLLNSGKYGKHVRHASPDLRPAEGCGV